MANRTLRFSKYAAVAAILVALVTPAFAEEGDRSGHREARDERSGEPQAHTGRRGEARQERSGDRQARAGRRGDGSKRDGTRRRKGGRRPS